ncbi:2731_t:CDS:2 [Dentiscutata erythropus]|uniref:2731_t:CDS:1 n=1 Tax=Dentiscutata erythropus TaxID=1348616 RepID=A0A9N9FM66_9GLOM|nr:2731_t:CDS:2 [Dentiscutata erythropus]
MKGEQDERNFRPRYINVVKPRICIITPTIFLPTDHYLHKFGNSRKEDCLTPMQIN